MDILNSQLLTLEDWQNICRQNLAIQKQFTTNLFTNFYGVTPEPSEIYIPVVIKAERSLTCITEKCFFEEVFQQGKSQLTQWRRIALIGKRGSGKTTRLQKIADFILDQKLGLPIWISLADLTQLTITQYIEEIWLKQTSQSFTIDEFIQQKKQIWLLLDGWDEMISKLERHQVSALLDEWMQRLRVVITCWDNVWEADKNAFLGFDIFHHFEFNSEQVTDYIRCWFATMGDATAGDSLEAALAKSENCRIKVLIENPLRLWMLCQIWQTEGSLPQTPAGLYGQFMNCVYRWKEDEEIFNQREAIYKALARLALAGMEQKEEVSRFRLPESWVVEVLGSRRLFQMVMKLGLLNRVEGLPEAICTFYHATFQEYFAALAVDDWDYFLPRNHVNLPVEGKEYRIFELRWKQVILFWFGREDIAANEKESFLEKLINFDDGCGSWNYARVDKGFYEYRANFLTGAIINEFKHSCFADTIVNQIVKYVGFLQPISEKATSLLKEIDREISITPLLQLLNETSNEEICRKVLVILAKIGVGNQVAIACLIQFLDKSSNKQTLKVLLKSLADIAAGNEGAISRLIQLLDETSDQQIRRIIFESLGDIAVGNEGTISRLIQLLDETSDQQTRWNIVSTLGHIAVGNEGAISRLIRFIDEISDQYTIRCTASSLGKIAAGNEAVITRLIQLLDETSKDNTRLGVALTLRYIAIENEEVISRLIQLLDETSDKFIRSSVASSLGEMPVGNEEAIARLIQLLDETYDELTSSSVALSLGKIAMGNEEAIVRLIQLLKETSNEKTPSNIAKVLGKIAVGNEGAIARLIQLLDETSDENTRKSIVEIFSKIAVGNEGAIAGLILLLDETYDEFTRSRILYSLGEIAVGNEEAIARLILLLDETLDEFARRSIAESLGKIAVGNQEAITRLIQLLDETPDEYTPTSVAESLGKIAVGNEEAITRLMQLLDETSNENDVMKIVYSLSSIAVENQEVIDRLIQLLDETSNEYTLNSVVESFGYSAVENEKAIARLILLLDQTSSFFISWIVSESLVDMAMGNERAITRLIQLLNETLNEDNRWRMADILDKIIATKKQNFTVIFSLKHHLNNETYNNKFNLYQECYRLIWKYAQNLPYPDFYRAWHSLNEA